MHMIATSIQVASRWGIKHADLALCDGLQSLDELHSCFPVWRLVHIGHCLLDKSLHSLQAQSAADQACNKET